MVDVERLGAISAITYSCNIPTARGLCKTDKGSLYRHEWHVHSPQLAKTKDGKWHILCSIKFRDGQLLDGLKTGIDDLPQGERQNCELLPAVPNPNLLDVVGELVLIEMKGKGPNYKFEGAILCVSKKGDHLFVLDKKDLSKVAGAAAIERYDEAHANPDAPFIAPVPCKTSEHESLPAGYPRSGIYLWGDALCKHCQSTKLAAGIAGFTIYYVDTSVGGGRRVANERGIRAIPLLEIWKDGKLLKSHAGELSAGEFRAWAS